MQPHNWALKPVGGALPEEERRMVRYQQNIILLRLNREEVTWHLIYHDHNEVKTM
jgi:hypothetical protein